MPEPTAPAAPLPTIEVTASARVTLDCPPSWISQAELEKLANDCLASMLDELLEVAAQRPEVVLLVEGLWSRADLYGRTQTISPVRRAFLSTPTIAAELTP